MNDVLEQTASARDQYWAAIGAVESDVLAHLISPGLTGGPKWPTTRQAYRVVRCGNSIILATDGMSDPFDDESEPNNGFDMELFLETSDIPAELAGKTGDVSRISESWAFALLRHVADAVADAFGILPALEKHGALSMEFPGVSDAPVITGQLPGHFITEDDCIGILIGQPDPDFPTMVNNAPVEPIRMVPVVLITAAELEHIREGGAAARKEIVEKLAASHNRHRIDLKRQSLTQQ